MITRRTCSGMRKNRFVTPTQIINASLAVWLRLGVIAAVIRELLQHRGFAKNNRPVVYTSRTELQCEDGFGEIWPEPILDGSDIALYLYASPSPERDQIRRDHAEWSQDTFGDVGPTGPLKHLSLEALETAEAPGNYAEWADMQFYSGMPNAEPVSLTSRLPGR